MNTSEGNGMGVILWLATMLFFVAFFSYGYVLWSRSKQRRAERSEDEELRQ